MNRRNTLRSNRCFHLFQPHPVALPVLKGQRFRDMVLSRGNTIELGKMYRDFRGHDPDIKPLLKSKGLD